mmetsp:Transcript_13427/g.58704  ORF Transcript_13427/g.58704 Transcript_13427/m.58704 type:complete len:201 (-) Transcript_13427:1616-2218(-)
MKIFTSAILHSMAIVCRFLPMTRDIIILSATGTRSSSAEVSPLSPPPPRPARVFLSSPSEASFARTSSMVGAGSPNLSARARILPSSSAIQAGSCAAAGPFLAFGAGCSASRDLRLRSPRRSPPGLFGPPSRALPSRRPRRSSGKPRPGLPRKSMPFFANRSSIMSLARSTSGTRPTMTTVVLSRSAHTFAAVACSIFFT